MGIQYPTGLIRSALSISIGVALLGCAATPGNVNQSGKANPAFANSAERQSNLDRARAEFSRGNYGNAIVLLEAELANRPASVAALNGLGACYDQLGRFDVAQRYYYRALDMSPESSITLSNIGYSYMQEGRHEEAIQILELALQRDTNNKTAASNLAMAQAKFNESGLESTIATNQTDNTGASDQSNSISGNSVVTPTTSQSVAGASLVEILDSIAGSQPVVNDIADIQMPSRVIEADSKPDQPNRNKPNPNKPNPNKPNLNKPNPNKIVAELFENHVVQPAAVALGAIPSLPSPASLTSAVSETNSAAGSSLNPSASVTQPETKVAALNPVPVPASSSMAIASAQTNSSLTDFMPTAPSVPEPAAVVPEAEPETAIEKSAISALELPASLNSAVARVSENTAASASQATAFPQPENKISTIDPLPNPTISQQSFAPALAANQMRDMTPSPAATPLPLPAELAVEQIPVIEEFSAPALMSSAPQIVATQQLENSAESNIKPSDISDSLVLTVLDMNNVPELTLRILESQEPSPAEVSDLQNPLQEPANQDANGNQQIADLGGAAPQSPIENPSDTPETAPDTVNNGDVFPQLALAQSNEIQGAPSVQIAVGEAGEAGESGEVGEDKEQQQSATTLTGSYNLAVANGNGMKGIARATSTWLDTEQLKIAEVVDADNFNYSQTVIKHRPEFAEFAMEMAAQMAVNCEIQVTDELLDGVDMQLILGQDFASNVNVKDGWLSFSDENISQINEELRLEISNGNGVVGMAARLRNFLQEKGSSVVKLTNADNYGYSESTLYYRPGTRAAAEDLLLALPVRNVSLVESTNLTDTVDARLLLGRDFVPYDIGPGEI